MFIVRTMNILLIHCWMSHEILGIKFSVGTKTYQQFELETPETLEKDTNMNLYL